MTQIVEQNSTGENRDSESGSHKKRLLLIAAAIVLMLAAAFAFLRNSGNTEPGSNQVTGKVSERANTAGISNSPVPSAPGSAGAAVRPALSVSVSSIQSEIWPSKLSANGSVAAWQEAIIGTELNGVRLLELLAQVGDTVKRGQVLAKFSSDLLSTELAQQNATLAEAEASFAEAQSNARRAMQLKESGAISIQQITQYATVRNTAVARVSAAKAGVQAAQLRLQQARVLAPDDGIISARSATVGMVGQSGQELFRLIRQGRLEWRAEVSADDSARISIAQATEVFAVDGAVYQGKVRMVAPTVDPQTRKSIIYVDLLPQEKNQPKLPKELKALRPGMFAKGEFLLGESTALSVPASALVMRDGYASIFVLSENNQVRQLRVTTGRSRQDRIEVIGAPDLSGNLKVIDSGAAFLADGDLVRVVSATPPAAAPADPLKPPAKLSNSKVAAER